MAAAVATEPQLCCVLRWAFNFGAWQPKRAEWLLALRSIQADEVKRIQSFAYQRDAKASLIGRLMLRRAARHLLSQRHVTLANAQLLFERSKHGRPFLKVVSACPNAAFNLADLDVNVSHQGDWTLLVAADKGRYRVGVDVMRVERPTGVCSVSDFFKSMRRQFSSAEWACIDASGLSEQVRLRRFYRHWCIKESFVKCEGRGLGFSLDRLECQLAQVESRPAAAAPRVEGVAQLLVDKTQPAGWCFEEHRLDENHVAAVAWWDQQNWLAPALSPFEPLLLENLLSENDVFNNDVKHSEWESFNRREALPKWLSNKRN